MYRTVHFKTSAPEEWTFDANENPKVPGGQALAQRLCSGLEREATAVSAPSQHSYYGWRFEATFDGVAIDCVLNAAGEECYLTIETASILPVWLLPGRRRALTKAQGVFDALLRQLPEITEVTWS